MIVAQKFCVDNLGHNGASVDNRYWEMPDNGTENPSKGKKKRSRNGNKEWNQFNGLAAQIVHRMTLRELCYWSYR